MNLVQGIRSTLRSCAALGTYGASRLRPQGAGTVRVLTYHRVLPPDELAVRFVQPGMYVSPRTFEGHLVFLQREFRVIGLDELLTLWDKGPWDPRARYCVITFDDGWVDTYRHAFPILRSAGMPATVFLSTEKIGTPDWFWPDRLGEILMQVREAPRESALIVRSILSDHLGQSPLFDRGDWAWKSDEIIEQCKGHRAERVEVMISDMVRRANLREPPGRCLMSWEEAKIMGASGISFGSHAATHRILTVLNPGEARHELESSLETLRGRGVNLVPALAYPNGAYSTEIAGMAREAGYALAFTTQPGSEGPAPADRLALHRIGVHEDVSATTALFAAHLVWRGRSRS